LNQQVPLGHKITMLRFLKKRPAKLKAGYDSIKLSEDEITQQAYKRFLGGGAERWEARGAFQLHFLQRMGLKPSHHFLDVGCGPIRAGTHFIKYLNERKYYGIDYNSDFILAARKLIEKDERLVEKKPVLKLDDCFGLNTAAGKFDFVLAFSVFNHCNPQQCIFFLNNVRRVLKSTGKVYITHASWFKPVMLATARLELTNNFCDAENIPPDVRLQDWGFEHKEGYPILEFSAL
jgi:SAM-dependent methyltransferase